MKFSCGLAEEARQQRKLLQSKALVRHLRNWHKVFLWWPTVTGVDGEHAVCSWLTTVERRFPNAWYSGTNKEVLGLHMVHYREIKEEDRSVL